MLVNLIYLKYKLNTRVVVKDNQSVLIKLGCYKERFYKNKLILLTKFIANLWK